MFLEYKLDLYTDIYHLEVCAVLCTLRVLVVVLLVYTLCTNATETTEARTAKPKSIGYCVSYMVYDVCFVQKYSVHASVTITLPLLSLYTVRSLRAEGAHALLLPTLL